MVKEPTNKNWKSKLHEIIYEADTPAGKLFDVVLLIIILASILLVMLESVDSIDIEYHSILYTAEWIITILFSIEYIARIITVKRPWKYVFSFYGIIDFLSTIPMYLSFFIVGSSSFVAFRALRLLRVFRILKLTRYIGASTNFVRALKTSRAKIAVFLSFVIILCIILGTVMFIAAIIMIMGYGIIAVPTGIVSSEMTKATRDEIPTNTQSCSNCLEDKHKDEAKFCHNCGHELHT